MPKAGRTFGATSHAIDVPGAEASRIGEIARDNAVHMVVGVIERDGGTLYCSSLTYAPSGKLLYKHRKLMPTALERLVWGFGSSSTIGVVDTPIGRIGSVICSKTICRFSGRLYVRKAWNSIVRPPSMTTTPGFLQCAPSRSGVAALSSPPVSIYAGRRSG